MSSFSVFSLVISSRQASRNAAVPHCSLLLALRFSLLVDEISALGPGLLTCDLLSHLAQLHHGNGGGEVHPEALSGLRTQASLQVTPHASLRTSLDSVSLHNGPSSGLCSFLGRAQKQKIENQSRQPCHCRPSVSRILLWRPLPCAHSA